ncbi:interferon alpha/beta receptor 2-like isoform 1-T2 [Sarcophilus harrisii]
MLLSQWTLFIGLLFFFPQESICLSSSCTSLEMPVKNDILTMTSHNFQHILSWKLSSNAIIPTHYTVSYTIMSAYKEWKAVEKCTNITKSSCNMTDIYETNETYLTSVTGFNSKKKLFECVFEFLPITDTILDPPEVSIFYFEDAINVTVHFPESLSIIKNKEKELFSSVVIKVKSHDMSEQFKVYNLKKKLLKQYAMDFPASRISPFKTIQHSATKVIFLKRKLTLSLKVALIWKA